MSAPGLLNKLSNADVLRRYAEYVAVTLIAGVALGWLSFRIRVDDDEGSYLLAAQAVLDGKLPYIDFFYPQLPSGIYLLAGWSAVWGHGVVSGRALSVVLSALTLVFVYHAVRRGLGPRYGFIAVLFACTYWLFAVWAGCIKTYPLMLFTSTASLVIATSPTPTSAKYFVAGFIGGLGAAGRLPMVPLLPCLLLVPLFGPGVWKDQLRSAGFLLGGMLVGSLPILAFAIWDFDRFYFDNITYHSLRRPGAGLIKNWPQKMGVLSKLHPGAGAVGFQASLLLVGGAIGVLRLRNPFGWATGAALFTLTATALLPSPTWRQYFVVVAPFGAILTTYAIQKANPVVAVVLVSLFVAAPAGLLKRELERVDAHHDPIEEDAVGRKLAKMTRESPGVIASHWPSYLAAARGDVLPAAVSRFARNRFVAPKLSPEERLHYHVFTDSDFEQSLVRGEASYLVLGRGAPKGLGGRLQKHNWRKVWWNKTASIWVAPKVSSQQDF
jgi:hypothetical protein